MTVKGARGSSCITISPQLVFKVRVLGKTFAAVSGGLVFSGVCGLAVVFLQEIAADATGAEIANVDEINSVKTIEHLEILAMIRFLLPLNCCWRLTGDIENYAIYFAHFIGYSC